MVMYLVLPKFFPPFHRVAKIIMLAQLRLQYPQSCLITELLEIKHGKYIVKALVQIEGVAIATGLGSGETVETAEDRARERVLAVLGLEIQSPTPGLAPNVPVPPTPLVATPLVATPLVPTPVVAPPVMAAVVITEAAASVTTPVVAPVMASVAVAPSVVQPPAPEIKTPEIQTPEIKAPVSVVPPPQEIAPEVVQEAFPLEETTEETKPPFPIAVPEKTEGKSEKVVSLHIVPDTQPLETPHQPIIAVVPDPEPLDFGAEKEEKKAKAKTSAVAIPDIKDVMAKTEIEIRRLGWTTQQGRNFLLQRYGKRARTLLSDEELLDFLSYLEDQLVAE
jgi:hypothetical protein